MSSFVEELIPCPDPWDVARRLAHRSHLLFLDSSDRHPDRGRFSYVMADPTEWFESSGRGLAPLAEHASIGCESNLPGLPPFQGGYAGLFGYGIGRSLERIPAPRTDEFRVPDLAVGRYDWVVAFDHARSRAWFIARGGAANAWSSIRDDLESNAIAPPTPNDLHHSDPATIGERHATRFDGVYSNFPRERFLRAVRRVIEYIHAGDAFQVNLAQRLLAKLADHPLALFGRLRERCPAPYGCYFDLGRFQIASASPEQFLQMNGEDVRTRPIKGTRPRGRTAGEDAAQLRDLVANPKDRAENVMIVDLLRNDLGRVCEYGSIHVPKVCEVESYNYVHHLVSEVRGRLRSGRTPFDLLRAAFPGGSVTGAPKVRAMEIIAELEPTARGPYCGSIGFVGFDGAMDSNILIRTFTAGGGWLQFPVGGGIVADSDPEREYEETLHKAAGLLRALAP
jgi:para-aminobenzoate synthetase component I